MALKDIELRILGSLIEKEKTTPETYPLTDNSLRLACNQKSSREPVTSFSHPELSTALQNLRDKGLVVSKRTANERSVKHSQKFNSYYDLSNKELAIMAVLMLRGKQTPGELRTRSDRYNCLQGLSDVEETLQKLANRQKPLVKNLGRSPGQSQDRWQHTLGLNEEDLKPRIRQGAKVNIPSAKDELKAEINDLKRKLRHVYRHLGLDFDE